MPVAESDLNAVPHRLDIFYFHAGGGRRKLAAGAANVLALRATAGAARHVRI
jgi:hypothetical protein